MPAEYHLQPRETVIGFDLAIGDGVVWHGQPWTIISFSPTMEDGRPGAELIPYPLDQDKVECAPLRELRVFRDAVHYRHESCQK